MIDKFLYKICANSYRIVLYLFFGYLLAYFFLEVFEKTIPEVFNYGFWYIFGMHSGFFILKGIIKYIGKHHPK